MSKQNIIIKTKKTLILSILLTFFLSACSSKPKVNPINPLSNNQKEINIPNNAPKWLVNNKIKNNISSIGVSAIQKKLNEQESLFYRKKALINASQNFTKTVYSKTKNIYKNYIQKLEKSNVFDKDIKKTAEHVSLKSLSKSKISNIWLSSENNLFVQISVETNIVAQEIQNSSKTLFDVDNKLYKEILSNRAKIDIINKLEK